ncbi:hypothetical protein EYF80_067390 [Liparis tanakae]|uniref:Uncharacterized protein n=1 Tax=Liparis tanakae TaxID=230148 RepID=A0A4Z2E0Z3_9TELE|nr:hypothetical protein EYF80_067390 [Liparis tanakae]
MFLCDPVRIREPQDHSGSLRSELVHYQPTGAERDSDLLTAQIRRFLSQSTEHTTFHHHPEPLITCSLQIKVSTGGLRQTRSRSLVDQEMRLPKVSPEVQLRLLRCWRYSASPPGGGQSPWWR